MEYIPSQQVREWCKAHGWNAEHYTEAFNDYLLNRTKKPYKNMDAAFRNCVRSDWFRIRRNLPQVSQRDKERAETIAKLTGRTEKVVNGEIVN